MNGVLLSIQAFKPSVISAVSAISAFLLVSAISTISACFCHISTTILSLP